MKEIIVHHDAEIELWKAVQYYEQQKSGLGLDLEKEIRQALPKIQKSPNRWPKKIQDTRRYLLKKFPFAIYYLELCDSIWIVAYAHTRRRPFYWKYRI